MEQYIKRKWKHLQNFDEGGRTATVIINIYYWIAYVKTCIEFCEMPQQVQYEACASINIIMID